MVTDLKTRNSETKKIGRYPLYLAHLTGALPAEPPPEARVGLHADAVPAEAHVQEPRVAELLGVGTAAGNAGVRTSHGSITPGDYQRGPLP